MSDATPYITFSVNSRPSLWKRLSLKTMEPHDVVSVNVPEHVTADWNMSLDDNGKAQVKSKRQVLHVYSSSRQYMEMYRVKLSIKNTISLLFHATAGVFNKLEKNCIRFQRVEPIEAGVLHSGDKNRIIGYAWIEDVVDISDNGLFGKNGIIAYKDDVLQIDKQWFPVIKDVMQQIPHRNATHVLVNKETDIIASSNMSAVSDWIHNTESSNLADFFTMQIFKSLTKMLSLSITVLKTTTVVIKTHNMIRKVDCRPVLIGKKPVGYMLIFTASPETRKLIASFQCALEN